MSLPCYVQTVDMLPQRTSIFTTCLSFVFLLWHYCCFTHPQELGVKGLHYPCFAMKLPQLYILTAQKYPDSCWNVCINMWVNLCVNVNTLGVNSVSWQPLPLAGLLSCGTQCRSIQAALFPSLCWIYKALIQAFLKLITILVPFLIYCAVILVNKARTTLCA